MSEKELTPEELKNVDGGRKTRRANKPLQSGTIEEGSNDPGVSVGGVEPLPDPPFQAGK